MNLEQLPSESQPKLDRLLRAVEQALNASRSPHTRAVSGSSMPLGSGPDNILYGGNIGAPPKPPFEHDKAGISAGHRAVLQSGNGVLFGNVVHGERADARAKWRLLTKLISRAEHNEMTATRQPIDAGVERELRRLAARIDWEWSSFGRDVPKAEPKVVRDSTAGLKKVEADSRLLTLLGQAEHLYRDAGLDLVIADWTLTRSGLEFQEYIE